MEFARQVDCQLESVNSSVSARGTLLHKHLENPDTQVPGGGDHDQRHKGLGHSFRGDSSPVLLTPINSTTTCHPLGHNLRHFFSYINILHPTPNLQNLVYNLHFTYNLKIGSFDFHQISLDPSIPSSLAVQFLYNEDTIVTMCLISSQLACSM